MKPESAIQTGFAEVRHSQADGQSAVPHAGTALEVKDLHAGYAGREILKGISFSVAADDFFAIIGPSGAGKSTLIRCVNRLVEPTSGAVIINGRDILQVSQSELRGVRRNIGMIFQEFNLIERLSVIDNVLTGRLGYTGTVRSLFQARADAARPRGSLRAHR
jgi:phosphonate transport system ATP-binding protein